jgi:two-component system chemotaxis response regulator CheB
MVPTEVSTGARPVAAVVIGGSAGSVAVLGELLPGLPANYPPVLIVIHVLPSAPSLLASLFAPVCALRVVEADPGVPLERGTVYFAPADYHLLVEPTRRCALSIEPPVLFSRPAIDVLFESAADVYGPALVGVVLTGASADGAEGLAAIARQGGRAIVQDPATAESKVMPSAALAAVPDARVVPLSAMLAELRALEPVS